MSPYEPQLYNVTADVPTIVSIAGMIIILTGLSLEMISNDSVVIMECYETAAENVVHCIKILKMPREINAPVKARMAAPAAEILHNKQHLN